MIARSEVINWEFNAYSLVQEAIKNIQDCGLKYIDAGQYNWREFKWIHVYYKANEVPTSGWKIHVSANIYNADKILERILPLLIMCRINFKVAYNIDFLAFLNNNPINKKQEGKYITLYPTDIEQAKKVAEEIHKITLDFVSPTIISDQQYRESSIVYYRYGSFIAQYVQSLWGSLMPTMNVNGSREFDFKNPNASFMDKVKDPFNKYKVSNTAPELDPLKYSKIINEIYIEYCYIFRSQTTEVVLCLDIKNQRRCILKRATPNTSFDLSGLDAAERLRAEQRILEKLQDKNVSPKPYDAFYDNEGRYCLVMEDLPGISLADYLQSRIFSQQIISVNRVIKWARELAEKMQILHHNNVLHSDLKLANIIYREGALVLIDFDSASDFDSNTFVRSCGSTGFSTNNRDRGNIATVKDDIFGYGAVLYYLFGMVNPSVNPLEPDQKDTSLSYLNKKVPAKYIKLIHDCLAGNFESFSDIRQFINSKNIKVVSKLTADNSRDLIPTKLEFLLDNYLKDYYKTLKPGKSYNEIVIGDIVISDFRGIAGSLIGLTTARLCHSQPSLDPIITEFSQVLVEENALYNKIPGLYVGESGKAVGLLYAAVATKNNQLREKAILKMQEANNMPLQSVDIFNGVAGRIRSNLIFNTLTENPYFYDMALDQTNFLLNSKVRGENYIGWFNPTVESTAENLEINNKQILLGYAHGIAGIGDAFLDMYLINKDPSLLKVITEIINTLMEHSQSAHSNKSLLWAEAINGPPLLSFWCHGGAGIAIFICRAMHYGVLPRNDDLIQKLVYPIIHFTRSSAPILCHGSVGNLACLLDINQYCPGSISDDQLQNFEKIIAVWLRNYFNNSMKTTNVQIAFVGYLTGLAGIISLYARLNNKDIPNPLNIEFAEYLKECL